MLQKKIEELEGECSKFQLDLDFEKDEKERLERELNAEKKAYSKLEHERNILLEINQVVECLRSSI